LVLQFTALVALPFAKAVHWLFCRDWIVPGVQLTVMAVNGVTVTVALPLRVVVWIDVAVIVTLVLALTDCAVKAPFWSTVPALVPHETALLKLPEPVTVAVHWLV
jgi:hypothetical protein